jgi:formylglycine-generating enzyme required for sulfatase activity
MLARLGDPRPEVMTVDAMQFCYVPPGPFWMGEDEEEHLNEHLDYEYWIARYPVTVAQFRIFVEATRLEVSDPDCLRGLDPHPVVLVSWHEALAFCKWVAQVWREEGKLLPEWGVSLPSEAEWEKAARGGVEIPSQAVVGCVGRKDEILMQENQIPKRAYPWGDKLDIFDIHECNILATGINTTSSVGNFPQGSSPYGVEDLAGNVMEWTRSLWGEDVEKPVFEHPYDPGDGREDLTAGDEVLRVLRGGGFMSTDEYARCASGLLSNPNIWESSVGFRLVVNSGCL